MTKHDSDARSRALADTARRRSRDKREAALEACARLGSLDRAVTFPLVAVEAGVSTWLLRNVPELTNAVRAAQERQRRRSKQRAAKTTSSPEGPSTSSLRTDLALARHDANTLRSENERLQRRLELQLGAEVEGASNQELLDRIRELEGANDELRRSEEEARRRVHRIEHRIEELEAELETKSELVRSMMFARNTSSDT